MQHVVRAATKEYPDAAEIKGCIAIPCKSRKLLVVNVIQCTIRRCDFAVSKTFGQFCIVHLLQ